MTSRRLLLSGLAAVLVATLGHSGQAQGTWRVSVDSTGVEGDAQSGSPVISGDGRFVAFHSNATNLVPGDTNGFYDVFLHDRQTGATTRVSVDSSGAEANGDSTVASMTPDGRFVSFQSRATNLVTGDTNGWWDGFVHDRQTGTTTRVSVNSSGGQGDSDSSGGSMTADGRFVAFSSSATNLVVGDTNGWSDVFVHDRQTAATTRVSVDSSGGQGDGDSFVSSISADARFVGFTSWATNLVPGDTNGFYDVFMHDRQTGATTRVSVDSSGLQGNGDSSGGSMTADGRFVAFSSSATNLVVGDTNGWSDAFVHDRQTGATTRVSLDSSGVEGNSQSGSGLIAAGGRFVAFGSWASNLASGDTNAAGDTFVHDRQTGATTRVSVDSSGAQGDSDSYGASISADGRFVAFSSSATNLVAGDTNGALDAFVHGPDLTLEASPEIAPPGTNLSLTTWGGMASGPAMLYAVDVSGSPVTIQVARGAFDANGMWTLSATVPPGLSGNVVTFLAFGLEPDGRVGLTNQETMTFQ